MIKLSRIITFVVIFAWIGLVIYFNAEKDSNMNSVYQKKIAGKVTKLEEKNRGGYIYYYRDSFFWASYFMESRRQVLQIGDSIYKPVNSMELKIYRKNSDGTYKYFKTFKGSRHN